MLKVFQHDIVDPEKFVITLELVPRRASFGKSIDTILAIAQDAFNDGRISAVSITDNPGGNPSLGPDVLGYEIFKQGLDVIVHFTCRDINRIGMESRALQLARMGMKNILALTGDYSGKGFGGQGAPVFDFDSVILSSMLKKLSEKLIASGDPEEFFTGCAVSPFKTTEAECHTQYKKLDKKIEAGASFIITQLGYDVKKFLELIIYNKKKGRNVPIIGSVYLLSPRSARAMNKGKVPGAYISDDLFNSIMKEWEDTRQGLMHAIERTAKLGVILKGLGYIGIHIGGIHRNFKTVGAILDRMEKIEDSWEDFLDDFKDNRKKTYYMFNEQAPMEKPLSVMSRLKYEVVDHFPYKILKTAHSFFFNKEARLAPLYQKIARFIDKNNKEWLVKYCFEDPIKILFLSCQGCGDCGIQHVAFQCPESGCPKHTRNGPCGGSKDGYCEVYENKHCIWDRAYTRLKHYNSSETLSEEFVPPRKWELNKTSSWINFHMGRDHQG